MSPYLYTCETGAERLGGKVRASTLKRLAVNGEVDHVLIGGKIHYTEQQLVAAVDHCTRPADQKPAKRKPAPPTPTPAPPVLTGVATDLVARPGRRYRSTQ